MGSSRVALATVQAQSDGCQTEASIPEPEWSTVPVSIPAREASSSQAQQPAEFPEAWQAGSTAAQEPVSRVRLAAPSAP
jgi:hypothetical protein